MRGDIPNAVTEPWKRREVIGSATLYLGDCREVMAAMPENSIDAIVCDPPYGLEFMGKEWDYGVPLAEMWKAALRMLKPGGHLLSFGGTRTFHRMTCAIEDAGFEIRDTLMWVYGSGFPKSLDVSKAIDKAAGAKRTEIIGTRHRNVKPFDDANGWNQNDTKGDHQYTAPATDAVKQWQGWGTALKPAWEPVVMARKPLIGTVAANVLKHGTGALNVDGCRVGNGNDRIQGGMSGGAASQILEDGFHSKKMNRPTKGRWPANLIHDGSDEVLAGFPDSNGSGLARTLNRSAKPKQEGWGMNKSVPDTSALPDAGTGSAARFFYCAKASKADRNEGCVGMPEKQQDVSRKEGNPGGDNPRNRGVHERVNHHPTVKPTDLMRYLCRLVTPKGGTVLDPFMGSGSTGKAALKEGFQFIGIDNDFEHGYFDIACKRIDNAQRQERLFA